MGNEPIRWKKRFAKLELAISNVISPERQERANSLKLSATPDRTRCGLVFIQSKITLLTHAYETLKR